MAKDNKKKNHVEETEQMAQNTPENIDVEARIKSKNCVDESIAELGDIQEAEDIKKKKIQDYLDCKNKALYFRDLIILTHNKNRREEHALNDSIKAAVKLVEDVKSSKITPNEFDDAFKELAKEQNKKMQASNEKFDKQMKELKDAYPNYWRSEWDLQRIGILPGRRY